MKYIISQLKKIRDPRQLWKVKHSLWEILTICIIAIMCGARSSLEINEFAILREEWFKTFLELPNGIPHRLTINRVLSLLKPRSFEKVFMIIMNHARKITDGAVVSIDGKSYYSQKKNRENTHPLYMLNVWCNENSTILGSIDIDEKTNEITAIPEILKMLDVKGATITIDAIGCQKNIVKQITKENGANYVIGLKGNQHDMYAEMVEYAQFCLSNSDMKDCYDKYKTIDSGHGRIETREYILFHDISWFESLEDWAGLGGLVMVHSMREVIGKGVTEEYRYYITSLTDVNEAAFAIRSHWGIENKLHWSLDVLFNEDGWATREAVVAANLATIRKLALSFLRKSNEPRFANLSGSLRMWRCALDIQSLNSILFDLD